MIKPAMIRHIGGQGAGVPTSAPTPFGLPVKLPRSSEYRRAGSIFRDWAWDLIACLSIVAMGFALLVIGQVML